MTTKNPIRRLLDECGVKPAEFAEQYKFSRQAVDYLINGTYPGLSDKFYDSLYDVANLNGFDASYIDEDYESWRREARQENAEKYRIHPRAVWDTVTSPFDTYVRDTAGNRSRLAKDLKVPVRDVTRYARGEALAMPLELQNAFNQIGFEGLADLIAMQYNWRTEHR